MADTVGENTNIENVEKIEFKRDFTEIPSIDEIKRNMFGLTIFKTILERVVNGDYDEKNTSELYTTEMEFLYMYNPDFNREGIKSHTQVVMPTYMYKQNGNSYFVRFVRVSNKIDYCIEKPVVNIAYLYHKETIFEDEFSGITFFIPEGFTEHQKDDQDTKDLMTIIDRIFFLPFSKFVPELAFLGPYFNIHKKCVIASHFLCVLYCEVIKKIIPDAELGMDKFLQYRYCIASEDDRKRIIHILKNYDDDIEHGILDDAEACILDLYTVLLHAKTKDKNNIR